jgi:tetratricopeptide (TPR) repeat protein
LLSRRLLLPLLAALLFAAAACQRVPHPRHAGYRATLTPFAPTVPSPIQGARDGLGADPAQRTVSEAIDELIARSEGFARPLEDLPDGVQADIEQIFVGLGRLGELLGLYRARVAEQGADSPFAPRLAVLYTELGYRAEARALLDAALAEAPRSAELEAAAAIWLLEGPSSDDARRQAAVHLRRATDAEPGFTGIFRFGPDWVARTLATLPAEEDAEQGAD